MGFNAIPTGEKVPHEVNAIIEIPMKDSATSNGRDLSATVTKTNKCFTRRFRWARSGVPQGSRPRTRRIRRRPDRG